MVITVDSDMSLDLRPIAIALRGRYGPSIFPCLSCRLLYPFVTISLFRSGKMVITGTTNYTETLLAADLMRFSIWRKLGIFISPYNFRLVNVVGSLALGYALDLDSFFYHHQDSCDFQPEAFPGLRWTPEKKVEGQANIVCILYRTGAVVVTGAKTKEQLHAAYMRHAHEFPKFREGHVSVARVPAGRSKYRPGKMKKADAPRKNKRQKIEPVVEEKKLEPRMPNNIEVADFEDDDEEENAEDAEEPEPFVPYHVDYEGFFAELELEAEAQVEHADDQ